MSVTGATTRNDYIASDGQTVFQYTFQILDSADLKVLKNGGELSLFGNYTVQDAGEPTGGTITLTSGADDADKISVLMAIPIDRTTQYQNAGDFLAADVNGDMDKAYLVLNQLQSNMNRVVRPKSLEPTIDMTLPTVVSRANKFFSFDSSGRPTVTTGNPSAVPDHVSVEDYGVIVDGVTDNTVTLQSAIDIAAAARKPLYFPDNANYIRITGPLYVRSYSVWFGEGEIKNTNTEGNINSAVLMPGGFNPVYFRPYNTAVSSYTHYPIDNANSGRTIKTTTNADAANFAVGDLVWVSTVTTWVGNAGDYPITAHLSEVVSSNGSTGVIVLDSPLTEDLSDLYGSLRVCKAEDSSISDIIGNPLEFCKYAIINPGISISAPYGNAITRGGMYKCDFNFKEIKAKNAIFANAFVNTSVRVQTATTTRKLCDIAAFSSQFYIGIDNAVYDGSLAESNLPAYCRVGEASRNGIVEVKSNNCGGYIDPDPIVLIDSGCKNVGQIHNNVLAPSHGTETNTGSAFRMQQGVSSNRQIYIVSPAWTGGTAFGLNQRVINGGSGYQCITAGTSAASGGPTGTGSEITDGTVVWKYVTNVAAVGQTVLNYGTEFDRMAASRTSTLKVYLNNVLMVLGSGAGKYQVTDTFTTITLGTALLADDRVKIGLDSDYQKVLEDCWMDINAILGGNAARGASITDGAQNAIPPTIHNVKRCGFKNLKIVAPLGTFETDQAVEIKGQHTYIDNAQVSAGEIFISSYAEYATIRGYYELGARNLSSNSNVRITSKKGLLCEVGNQTNDQINVSSTSTTSILTAAFPANSLFVNDRWVIKSTGALVGTGGNKSIIFYRDAGGSGETYFTFTVDAAVSGNFTLEIQLIAQSLTQYTLVGVLNLENSDSISYTTDSTIDLGAINTFVVGASVVNASDTIRVHNIDGKFTKPYYLN
tara:strand:- start:222 stop:3023 length:2802 start_codon:yes stop_codon:yes gene_type:complete